MVYPLLSLYLTTTLGATPAIVGIIEGPEAPFYFGGVIGMLAALGMFLVVPKLTPDICTTKSVASEMLDSLKTGELHGEWSSRKRCV